MLSCYCFYQPFQSVTKASKPARSLLIYKVLKKLEIKLTKGDYPNPIKEQVSKPVEIYAVFKDIKDKAKETCLAVYMNDKLEIITYEVHSVGNTHLSLISPAEIFGRAFLTKAKYIILIHNHPSGKAQPSGEDQKTMAGLFQQARIMEMHLLDFIIVGSKDYWSMFEELEGGDYSLGAIA